jgi:hypothetical protein
VTVAVVVTCAVAGWVFGDLVSPIVHRQKLPWIVARASGLGAFVALGALNVTGLRFRSPARRRPPLPAPETLLRAHMALGPAVIALAAVHVAALLEDRYAGVGWSALFLPLAARYRPGAVTYGALAAQLMVVVAGTAALAGRRVVRARWAPIHHVSHGVFVLVWVHGVLAGSDTPALRGLYVIVGAGVALSALPAIKGARPGVGARTRAGAEG